MEKTFAAIQQPMLHFGSSHGGVKDFVTWPPFSQQHRSHNLFWANTNNTSTKKKLLQLSLAISFLATFLTSIMGEWKILWSQSKITSHLDSLRLTNISVILCSMSCSTNTYINICCYIIIWSRVGQLCLKSLRVNIMAYVLISDWYTRLLFYRLFWLLASFNLLPVRIQNFLYE